MTTTSQCGPALDACTCRRRGPMPRTKAQIDADHRAAVDRAVRSGFAAQPIPDWVIRVFDPFASGATSRTMPTITRKRAA